jgi:hypothetical protein
MRDPGNGIDEGIYTVGRDDGKESSVSEGER